MNGKPLPGNDGSEGLQMIRPYSNSLPVLTPEQHAANQRKIEEARQRLANMEKQNEEGHRRFVQQELRKRVEEGERARQMLESLSNPEHNQPTTAPNPALVLQSLDTSQHQHQEQHNDHRVIPSTARIEEITSFAPHNAAVSSAQSTFPNTPGVRGRADQSSHYFRGPATQSQSYNFVNNQVPLRQSQPRTNGMPHQVAHGRWITPQPLYQPPHPQQQYTSVPQYQWQQPAQRQFAPAAQAHAIPRGQLSSNQQRQPSVRPNNPNQSQYGQDSSQIQPKSIIPPPKVASFSTLDGALGQPSQNSRQSSSSSHRMTSSNQPNTTAAPQNHSEGTSIPKEQLVAEIMQKMGPNYISHLVAQAQSNSSNPPTRENKTAVTNQTNVDQPSTTVEIDPPKLASPNQVRSNIRHIARQRTSGASNTPGPVSETRSTDLSEQSAFVHTPVISSTTNNLKPTHGPNGSTSIPNLQHLNQHSYPQQPQTSSTSHLDSQSFVPHQFTSTEKDGERLFGFAPPGNGDPVRNQTWSHNVSRQNGYPLVGSITPSFSLSHLTVPYLPHNAPITPTTQPLMASSPRTPASADKRHLARDILRNLNSQMLSGKRKRSEEIIIDESNKRGRSTRDSELVSENPILMDSESSSWPDSTAVAQTDIAIPDKEEEEEEEGMAQLGSVETFAASTPQGSPQLDGIPTHTSIPLAKTTQILELIDSSDVQTSTLEPVAKLAAPVFLRPSPLREDDQPEAGPSKVKEPLFLPSPESSLPSAEPSLEPPASLQYPDDLVGVNIWEKPTGPLEAINPPSSIRSKTNKLQERTEFYVLVPPAPEWVIRAKRKSQKKAKVKRRQELRKQHLRDLEEVKDSEEEIDEIEDWDAEGEARPPTARAMAPQIANEQRRKDEIVEKSAIALTNSVLRKQPCKWRYCNVVMNTVNMLSFHVAHHVKNKSGPHICLWRDCARRFSKESKLLAHLNSHVRMPILCPYRNCEEAYLTPKDLVSHCLLEHKGDTYRPKSGAFKPVMTNMPAVPRIMPSYMTVPRDVRPAPISKERHMSIGPWVLRNIFAPFAAPPKRRNAAVPLRRTREPVDATESINSMAKRSRTDDYEFLRPKSPTGTTRSHHFDDLPCPEVSKLVHAGLTFWGPEVNESKEEGFISGDTFDDIEIHDVGGQARGSLEPPIMAPTDRTTVNTSQSDVQATPIEEQTETGDGGEQGGDAEPEKDSNCLLI